jgi:hypothetical protein
MDAWNHHRGDECPEPPDTVVEVMNEAGETLIMRAGDLCWSQGMDVEGRIVMWRPAVDLALLAAYEGIGSIMPRALAGVPC